MSMDIYQETSPGVYDLISQDGDFTNPITNIHYSRSGNRIINKLFVRCDDATSYTNIQVTVLTTDSADDIGSGQNIGGTGWGVKLCRMTSDKTPTENDWNATNYGAAVSFEDTSDSTVYQSFWVLVETPPVTLMRVQNKDNIALYITYIAD